MLKNVLIVVDDIEKSIEFYKDLFGLQVILKNEGNVILSEGLVLQDADVWGKTLDETSTPFNNMMELYFEDFDIDGLLSRYVFIVNRPKTENETVYYNVDYIHTAIYENKQIKFHYAEWTVKKELKFKKNGAFYVVSPWALTWDDENYYLVAYDAAAGIIKHYRVDKMRDSEIMEADRKGEASFKNFDLAAFAKKTFGMYGGVDAEVTLECRNELAGVVIDRFGHDVWMCPHGEDHVRARVPVAVSSQFFGWITGIGSGMRIVGPEDVRQQYKEYLQNVIQNYMD